MCVDSSADSGGIDRLSKSSALDLVGHRKSAPCTVSWGPGTQVRRTAPFFLASHCTRVRTRRDIAGRQNSLPIWRLNAPVRTSALIASAQQPLPRFGADEPLATPYSNLK